MAEVLDAAELARVREGLAAAPFRDGRASAGAEARRVKDNEQAKGDDPVVQELAGVVRAALERHPVFAALARPARWSNLMFSRYAGGQQYGLHTDDAAMRPRTGARCARTSASPSFCRKPTPTTAAPC